jgi:hypothetical protein
MKEYTEAYFCREHNGIIFNEKRDGNILKTHCSEEYEHKEGDEFYIGIAWIFTWADLGVDID